MLSTAIEEILRKKINGEVRFDAGSRALYATDASNYRQIPIGVVIPRDKEDVMQTLVICREFGVPVLSRGGGTSLCGQACNAAVILDFSKYLNRILEVNPENKTARVEPGVILDDLRKAAAPYGLTFGPDPATHSRCTLGGMIGNNSCGVHSVFAGKTVDNVESVEILTYDGLRLTVGKPDANQLEQWIHEGGRQGEIYAQLKALSERYAGLIRQRFPKIPRRVSGYNLDELLPENGFHVARSLVGTEGTCVIMLEATVNLIHIPAARTLVVLGYPDLFQAADDVPFVLSQGSVGLEGLDDHFVHYMRQKKLHLAELPLLPEGNGWLMVEFAGESQEESNSKGRAFIKALSERPFPPHVRLFERPEEQRLVWAVRESSFGASMFVPGEKDTFAGWEDSAVPPENLGNYLRGLRTLMEHYRYGGFIYGHFGDGCIHARITFDLQSEEGIKQYRSFVYEAADLVIRYGGSLSGEHGDGQAYAELLPKMFGEEVVEAFREFKRIWDPEGKMNPGKIVDAYRMDENLKYTGINKISSPDLHFTYEEDGGNFLRTSSRCIGIGKCRRSEGETMCPSFMATREEKHSTRGRAHLLHEMMRGEVIQNGWKDEDVKSSLDLCLACKACKSECPVNVDLATYKAEFLSHYYEGRSRPVHAYLFGYIHEWCRLGSSVPWAANLLTQTPLIRDVIKWMGGIASHRNIPPLSQQPFTHWYKKRKAPERRGSQVLLWPDTFNNFFYPQVAIAACEVLEKLGYDVIIPAKPLCCGRPFYDFGMLDQAKSSLGEVLNCLEPYIHQNVPVVGLEPSCLSVFRDELVNLFPKDEKARSLSRNAVLLSEFVGRQKHGRPLPQMSSKAVVHGHCHQKAVMGMDSERDVLSRLGLDFEILDTGCCGMAGAFGFEKAHFDTSMKIGEQVLLPKMRMTPKDTLIVTNGFSCREQIQQTTHRQVHHLAEIIRLAMEKCS
ncbi:MAG TPA: FAD-binding and (Fe-S)-binding domain-containing protein [bacterium]|nr:FAD-binding and (Fe-S)-binding domain-containing protein [bacterium]